MTAAPFPDYDDTAHCRLPGVDPTRFHPEKTTDSHTYHNTKALCTGGGSVPACPFLDGCREYGLTHAVHGIWGGLGQRERKAIRKARRIVPEPLSMGDIANVPTQPRPYQAAEFKFAHCPDCGEEMHPKSVLRHRRSKHGRAA